MPPTPTNTRVVVDTPTVTATPVAQATPASIAAPEGFEEGQVVNVVDGDTIDVMINGGEYRVRYILMDTPETYGGVEPFGPEASEANRRLVEGQIVRLEKDVSETDRYGRLLRYVYVGDLMVNEELLRLGLAQVATFPPDVKYVDRFLEVQRQAQAAGVGLWGSQPFEEQPEPTPFPGEAQPPANTSGYTGSHDPNGPDRDCGDFSTHAEAQAFFEAAGGPVSDPHRLDRDSDGIACEDLP
jgi:micrococcal nuclease